MHCASISCRMCGCLFWSSGMSSEREVNSGERSYIVESATRESGFMTLEL